MSEIAVEPTATAEWHSLVRSAGAACGTVLQEPVEAYLVFMLMRFTQRTAIGRHALAVQYLEGLQDSEDRLRDTGDECLLICGLFPQRVSRRALPFSYYVDMGRGAYHTLARSETAPETGPYETLAGDFVRLMELLQAMREQQPDGGVDTLTAASLARQTGSRHAWERAAPTNVALFDPARRR